MGHQPHESKYTAELMAPSVMAQLEALGEGATNCFTNALLVSDPLDLRLSALPTYVLREAQTPILSLAGFGGQV